MDLGGEEEKAEQTHPGVQAVEVGEDPLVALELGPHPGDAETQSRPLQPEVRCLPRAPCPTQAHPPPVRQYTCQATNHINHLLPIQRLQGIAPVTFAAEEDEADDHEESVEDLRQSRAGKRE